MHWAGFNTRTAYFHGLWFFGGRLAKRVTDFGAIGFALAGFTSWVMADTCIKLVGQAGLPAYEMVAFLGLFMALFLAVWAVGRGQGGVLRPHRVDRQLLRACLDMANNVCVVVALRHLSLTLFYILIFTAPITISLLSAVVLREGLPWRRAVAIGVGFAGVVVAVNPLGKGREGDLAGYGACLVCVACFSVNMVWSRVLTRTETPESLAFFSGLVTSAMGFALMLATKSGAWSREASRSSGGSQSSEPCEQNSHGLFWCRSLSLYCDL